MAVEDIFIMHGLLSIASVGAFIYLHNQTKKNDWIMKTIWLSMILIIIYTGFGALSYGYRVDVVSTEMFKLIDQIVFILMWLLILLNGYILLSVLLAYFKKLWNTSKGELSYGKKMENDTPKFRN